MGSLRSLRHNLSKKNQAWPFEAKKIINSTLIEWWPSIKFEVAENAVLRGITVNWDTRGNSINRTVQELCQTVSAKLYGSSGLIMSWDDGAVVIFEEKNDGIPTKP